MNKGLNQPKLTGSQVDAFQCSGQLVGGQRRQGSVEGRIDASGEQIAEEGRLAARQHVRVHVEGRTIG